MTRWRSTLLTVLAATVLLTSAASAEQAVETDNALLRQGLALYEELEYERAVEALSAALLEDNSREEQVLIYQTLGTLYVYLDRQQEAELALARLLCADADFDFGEYASPRIREVFDRVRQRWIGDGRPCQQGSQQVVVRQTPNVSIDHESPDSAEPGEALELRLSLEDPADIVRSVLLHYRAAGERGFNDSPATSLSGGEYSVTIPGDAIQPPTVEYFFRALDAEGGSLANLGTTRAPLRVPVSGPTEGRRSVARSWWLWTLVAVVVVGTGLGLGLGLGLREDPPEQPPDPEPTEATMTIYICDGETGACFNR